jgi:membrane-bound lytic murein transglycosylase B
MEVKKAEAPDPAVQKNGKDVRADATDHDREPTGVHDNLAPVRELAYQPGSAAKVEVAGPTEAQAHLPQFADVPAPGTLERPGRQPEYRAEAAQAKDTAADKLQRGAEVSPEGQALIALAEKKINVPGYPHAAKV